MTGMIVSAVNVLKQNTIGMAVSVAYAARQDMTGRGADAADVLLQGMKAMTGTVASVADALLQGMNTMTGVVGAGASGVAKQKNMTGRGADVSGAVKYGMNIMTGMDVFAVDVLNREIKIMIGMGVNAGNAGRQWIVTASLTDLHSPDL